MNDVFIIHYCLIVSSNLREAISKHCNIFLKIRLIDLLIKGVDKELL